MKKFVAAALLAMVLGAFPAIASDPFPTVVIWSGVPGATGYAIETMGDDGVAKITLVTKPVEVAYAPGTFFETITLDRATLIRLYALSGTAPFACPNFSAPSNAILVVPPIPRPCPKCMPNP